MRLDTSQQMRTEMRLRMAPRMIQSMEILQLPLMALQERIDQEMMENPLLVDGPDDSDGDDPTSDTDPEANGEAETDGELSYDEPTDGEQEPETATVDEESPLDDSAGEDMYDLGGLQMDDYEWDDYGNEHRTSRAALSEETDRKYEAMQNMAARPRTLQDHLEDQLSFLDLDAHQRKLVSFLIHNLDDAGYLRANLADIVRDFEDGASLEEAETALRVIQRLDPTGVGARSTSECLLLQMTPDMPHYDVIRTLVTHHMDDLQKNRLPQIERKSGISIATINEALEQLRRLNPRPGSQFGGDDNRHVVPDVIVEADEHGTYQVRLADEFSPQLSISRHYQRLLKNRQADPKTREFIQKKIQSARWLIESIEQRRSTLLKVAQAIIDHQTAFLDQGPEAIEPLKMQQIADRVGVHVTTVSRAVDDKWVQTPRGIFPLKRFFGGGTTTDDGEEVAWDTIKRKLTEIIDKEDKNNPLSDEELRDALRKEGLPVARRTVTKYRKALWIPSSRERKQFS